LNPPHTAASTAAPPPAFPPALWLIPGVYFLFVAAEFVVLTRLALTLTADGASAFAVGALASAFWSGIFVASTAAHAVVQRLGHARCFLVAMAASALAVASLLPHDAYAGWLAAAAVMGLGGGLVWVSGEAWLAEAAPRERRGLLIGLFETSVGLGMLAGPALLPLSLWAGLSPLAVALALMAAGFACAWPLLHVDEPAVHAHAAPSGSADARNGWRAFAVPLVAVAAASGLMESGTSSLLPSISMRLGFRAGHRRVAGRLHRRRQRADAGALWRAGRPHRPGPCDDAGLDAGAGRHAVAVVVGRCAAAGAVAGGLRARRRGRRGLHAGGHRAWPPAGGQQPGQGDGAAGHRLHGRHRGRAGAGGVAVRPGRAAGVGGGDDLVRAGGGGVGLAGVAQGHTPRKHGSQSW
jgi:MFS family permease